MLNKISKVQLILPHYLLSKIIYKVATCKNKLFKNTLIKLFIKTFNVNLENYEYKNIDDYKDFNSFFVRKLDLQTRVLDLNHPYISPADGNMLICDQIRNNKLFQAKGRTYSLSSLLGHNPDQARLFSNGSYFTIYLSPQDYHRVHMPCDGTLESMTYIPGKLFSVNNTSCSSIDNIFARNERVINIFKTNNHQYMAIILVGAMLVGSMTICWHGTITPPHGDRDLSSWDYQKQSIILKKGEELGYFQMGSTVIVLFSESLNFKQDLLNQHILFGSPIT